MRIVAIIPAHDEADRIDATIAALQGFGLLSDIVVVDDGSTDDTAKKARERGAHVIELDRRQGKGAALGAGVATLRADIWVFADGDLGASASQMAAVLEPVRAGDLDLAIASFPPPVRKGGFGIVKGAAIDAIARYGYPDGNPTGCPFNPMAPLSGQRALTDACLRAVLPFADGYGIEVAMTIDALRAGMRVGEVPTTMTHRETGRDPAGFIHRGHQYLDVRKAVARYRGAPRRQSGIEG